MLCRAWRRFVYFYETDAETLTQTEISNDRYGRLHIILTVFSKIKLVPHIGHLKAIKINQFIPPFLVLRIYDRLVQGNL